MALQISIPKADQHDAGFAPIGVDLPEAYIKIIGFSWHFQPEVDADGNAVNGEISIRTGIWPSKAARDTDADPIGRQAYVLRNPDTTNDVVSQGYAAIKAHGKFADLDLSTAIDV